MAERIPARGEFVEEAFWNRHANPWSVRGFVLTYPALVLAVYRRSRVLGAGVLLSLAANLRLVSPPETDDAWATRVVLGERVWLERGVRSSRSDILVAAVGGLVNLLTLRAAARRRPVETALGTAASMALMLLFFDRMARLYEEQRISSDGDESEA